MLVTLATQMCNMDLWRSILIVCLLVTRMGFPLSLASPGRTLVVLVALMLALQTACLASLAVPVLTFQIACSTVVVVAHVIDVVVEGVALHQSRACPVCRFALGRCGHQFPILL